MRRNVSSLAWLAALALAASALLATAAWAMSGSETLHPNTPRKVSTVKLQVTSLPAESTLPAGMTLTLQKGFSAVAGGAAASLCTTTQAASPEGNQCPAASEIGTGSETVTPDPPLFGATGSLTLGLSFYLGPSEQAGCAATVDVIAKVASNDSLLSWPPGHGIGNLCAHSGGVRISFPSLPSYAYQTTGSTIIVNALSISLGTASGAVTGPWRNPSSCPRSRVWTGSLGLAFASSSAQLPLKLACR